MRQIHINPKSKYCRIAIACVVLLLILVIVVKVHQYQEEQEYLKECYCKQNNAFLLVEGADYNCYISDAKEHRTIEDCISLPKLYFGLLIFNRSDRYHLTMQEVIAYLSEEYDDGDARIFTNRELKSDSWIGGEYLNINDYVQFVNNAQTSRCNPLAYYVPKLSYGMEELLKLHPEKDYMHSDAFWKDIDKMAEKVFEEY